MIYDPSAGLKWWCIKTPRVWFDYTYYYKRGAGMILAAAPHRSDILPFYPLSGSALYSFSYCFDWLYNINSTPCVVTALLPFPVVEWEDNIHGIHHHRMYWLPGQEIYDHSVSSVLSASTIPSDLLRIDYENPAGSGTTVLSGVAGFSYNSDEHTLRTLHYILRITTGGGLNEARFVWTKVPPKVSASYASQSGVQLYSETRPLYLTSNTVYYWHSYSNHEPLWKVTHTIWAESRRRDPTKKDVFVFLRVADDKRTVTVDEWPYLNSGERFFEGEFHTDILQVTWMNEKIIVLTDTDPMEIWEWDLDGTSIKLATTSISQGSDVLLVAHPNQQYAYVFAEGEQWIIFSDLTLEAHALDLTGKIGFPHLCFDIDGYVWLDGLKLDPSTFDVILDIQNARCNHTYVAVQNDDNTYTALLLDGTTEIHNLNSDYIEPLFDDTVLWRYPQRVVVPYNETDLQLISKNGDLENAEWLGWDGSNWVPYDGTNARIIDNTHIELEDGVFVEFDFSTGDLVAGDYFYFTAGQALIKDDVSELSGTMLLSPYHYEEAYYDITLTTPTVELDDPDDPQYFWWYPDVAKQANWWGMLQQWLTATFDDPEQTGEGETAVIKFEGNPEPGEVVVDTNTGKFTFNAADYNRTFQVHFMWRVDVDCPFT